MVDFEQHRLVFLETIQPLSQMANQLLDLLLQLWSHASATVTWVEREHL